MSIYSDVINLEQKLDYLQAIDFCRITKLIEAFNGAKVDPNTHLFFPVELERGSLESCFLAVNFFLHESGIGTYEGVNFQDNNFEISLKTLNILLDNEALLSEDGLTDLENYIEELEATHPSDWIEDSRIFKVYYQPDYDFESLFQWYSFCEALLVFENNCRELLKKEIQTNDK